LFSITHPELPAFLTSFLFRPFVFINLSRALFYYLVFLELAPFFAPSFQSRSVGAALVAALGQPRGLPLRLVPAVSDRRPRRTLRAREMRRSEIATTAPVIPGFPGPQSLEPSTPLAPDTSPYCAISPRHPSPYCSLAGWRPASRRRGMKGVNSGTLGLIFLSDFREAVKKQTISRPGAKTPRRARNNAFVFFAPSATWRLGGKCFGSFRNSFIASYP
jgi:hypothetical protein